MSTRLPMNGPLHAPTVAVLACLADGPIPQREIARITGIPLSSLHNHLGTLCRRRYITRRLEHGALVIHLQTTVFNRTATA